MSTKVIPKNDFLRRHPVGSLVSMDGDIAKVVEDPRGRPMIVASTPEDAIAVICCESSGWSLRYKRSRTNGEPQYLSRGRYFLRPGDGPYDCLCSQLNAL